VTINGGNLITLDGQNSVRHFIAIDDAFLQYQGGVQFHENNIPHTFNLENIILINGNGRTNNPFMVRSI